MGKRNGIAFVLCLIVTGCATSMPKPTPPACTVPTADRAWVDRAVAAWRMVRSDIAGIGGIENFQAVFFSEDCVLTSGNALAGDAPEVSWNAARHGGTITLPDGDELPAGVASFTRADEGYSYFVMSTPSVWRVAGVDGGPLGLDTLMVAVMLHEGVHVAQSMTYGRRVTALERRYSLPESFGDDSMQARFEHDETFAASIARETDLFFQAAAAADDETARRLASEARNLMRVRADRWFTDGDAFWRESEDVWLTLEGSGQWVAYKWLISDQGAAAPASKAIPGFARRSRWWSQNEGLGIVLALDRLGDPGWKRHAFGDGEQTVLEMLDLALRR